MQNASFETRSVVSRVDSNVNQQRWLVWLRKALYVKLGCGWIDLMLGDSQPVTADGM